MKKILTFIGAMLLGATLMYMYLWYDAYKTLEGAWCNISTTTECDDE